MSRVDRKIRKSLVEKTVTEAISRWRNAPQVVVFDGVDDLDNDARGSLGVVGQSIQAVREQKGISVHSEPQGFFFRNKVFINSSRMPDKQAVIDTLMHESLGHYGLRGTFGNALDSVLSDLVTLRKEDIARKMQAYRLDNTRRGRLIAAEEVLADIAQTVPDISLVQRATSDVRNWLRTNIEGLQDLELTRNDIITKYILPARAFVQGAGSKISSEESLNNSLENTGSISTVFSKGSTKVIDNQDRDDLIRKFELAQSRAREMLVQAGMPDPFTPDQTLHESLVAFNTALNNFKGPANANAALKMHLRAYFDQMGLSFYELFGPDVRTQYSAKLKPSKDFQERVHGKFHSVEPHFKAATGFGFDELTESEARYLVNYDDVERVRDRIAEAGSEASRHRNSRDISGIASGEVFSELPNVSRSESLGEFFNAELNKSAPIQTPQLPSRLGESSPLGNRDLDANNPDIRYKSDEESENKTVAAGASFKEWFGDWELAAQNAAVNQAITQWDRAELKSGEIIQVGMPSDVLRMFGLPYLPIHLTQRILNKAVLEKQDVLASDLRDLVMNIQAPIAVFRSKRGENHRILATQARHTDGNVIVVLELERTPQGLEINDITSINPKRDLSVKNWIDDGLLMGYEMVQGREWFENSAGSNSQQFQANSALEDCIIYETNHLRNTSKVVDKNGKPMVVYRGEHGDDSLAEGKFGNQFQTRLGSLSFGSKEAANTYALQPNYAKDNIQLPRIFPAYLSIKNPIFNNPDDPFVDLAEVAHKLGFNVAKQFALKYEDYIRGTNYWAENFAESYATVKDLLDRNPSALSDLYIDVYPLLDDEEFVQMAIDAGFDGAIHCGNGETAHEAEYRVFSTEQIKSAIGNNREFLSDNHITHSSLKQKDVHEDAPAIQPLKPTESAAFKAWFGDWKGVQRQKRIASFIDRALTDKQWQQRTLIASGLDADPSGKLSQTFGFDVVKQFITPDDIRKTQKKHGTGNEAFQDQIGLQPNDYVKLIELLRDPQTYRLTTSKNKKPSAEFGKRFSDGTFVVVEVEISEQGAISIKTGWKKAPGRNHAGAMTYPIRTTSENAAGIVSILHSDTLLVNEDSVSKVVDADGNPLVMYHGTKFSSITSFNGHRGVAGHFSFTPEIANDFAMAGHEAEQEILADGAPDFGDGGTVYPAYLQALNIFDARNPAHKALIGVEEITGYEDLESNIEAIKSAGFDSYYDFESSLDDITGIAVFKPTQIKSALSNRDFEANNPDIRFKLSDTTQSNPDDNLVAIQAEIEDLRKLIDADPISEQAVESIHALKEITLKDATRTLERGEAAVYVLGDGDSDTTYVLTPSAQNPGQLQLTRYVKSGAFGDSQYTSISKAIDENGLIHMTRLPLAQAEQRLNALMEKEVQYQDAKQNNLPSMAPAAVEPTDRDYGKTVATDFSLTLEDRELVFAAGVRLGLIDPNESIAQHIENAYKAEKAAKKTSLTLKQWVHVKSPEFKKWFGNWESDPANASQALDENGQPKVYYHGSPKAGFTKFDVDGKGKTKGTGAFFTDDWSMARGYAGGRDSAQIYLPEELLNDPTLTDGIEITKGILVEITSSDDGEKSWQWFKDEDAALEELDLSDHEVLVTKPGYQILDPNEDSHLDFDYDEAIDYLKSVSIESAGIYEVFLNVRDMLVVDWGGNNWDEGPEEDVWVIEDADGEVVEYVYSQADADATVKDQSGLIAKKTKQRVYESTDDAARQARDIGCHGILIKNVVDTGPHGYHDEGNIISVFDPKNIKSADANNGKFDANNPDIRFKLSEEATSDSDMVSDITRNPSFQKWFDNSKVVDENGSPMVVYHGTILHEGQGGIGDITAFDRLFTTKFRSASIDTVGSWFSTNPGDGGAEMYSGKSSASIIYPVYLSIQNPQVTTFNMMLRRARMMDNGIDDGRRIREKEVNAYRKWLQDMGRDGIKIVGSTADGSTEFEKQDAWIALEPSQIKSAIGNNGEFNPNNPDIRYKLEEPSSWKSALMERLTNAPMRSSPTQGWLDAIKGWVSIGAVKQAEVEWSGVTDWLKMQEGKVTKEQLMDFLDSNGVQIKEITLKDTFRIADELNEKLEGTGFRAEQDPYDDEQLEYFDANDDGYEFDELPGEVQQIVNAQSKIAPSPTKYKKYTLAGGENYREVLLTLPIKQAEGVPEGYRLIDIAEEDRADGFDIPAEETGPWRFEGPSVSSKIYKTRQEAMEALQNEFKSDQSAGILTGRYQYKSSHWDQPNVLAHIRVNDRTDAEGNKVLFVEELQSDWGAAGRKKGFGFRKERMKQMSADEILLDRSIELNESQRNYLMAFSEEWDKADDSKQADLTAAYQQWIDSQQVMSDIPPAPFVTTTDGWLNLGLKAIIKMAVDGGYDRVAFINGEQSADRYDLSKHVKFVTTKWKVKTKTWELEIGYGLEKFYLTDDTLEDYVGKQLAKKIIEDRAEAAVKGKIYRNLDLKVGGEGMKAFYDKIVPNAINGLLKKFGAGRAERVDMDAGASGQIGFLITENMRQFARDGIPLFRWTDLDNIEETGDNKSQQRIADIAKLQPIPNPSDEAFKKIVPQGWVIRKESRLYELLDNNNTIQMIGYSKANLLEKIKNTTFYKKEPDHFENGEHKNLLPEESEDFELDYSIPKITA